VKRGETLFDEITVYDTGLGNSFILFYEAMLDRNVLSLR
jgi:hypothetical protein